MSVLLITPAAPLPLPSLSPSLSLSGCDHALRPIQGLPLCLIQGLLKGSVSLDISLILKQALRQCRLFRQRQQNLLPQFSFPHWQEEEELDQ